MLWNLLLLGVAVYSFRKAVRYAEEYLRRRGARSWNEFITGCYLNLSYTDIDCVDSVKAGDVATISCSLYNARKEPHSDFDLESFSITVSAPQEGDVSPVIEKKDASISVSFVPLKPGLHDVDIRMSGTQLPNMPLHLVVTAGPMSCEKTTLTPERGVAQVGLPLKLDLIARDEHSNATVLQDDLVVEARALACNPPFDNTEDATTAVELTGNGASILCVPQRPGVYTIEVVLKSAHTRDADTSGTGKNLAEYSTQLIGLTPKDMARVEKPHTSSEYWNAQFYRDRNGTWTKGWLYVTPSQIAVKESWAFFFTSKVFTARISASTSAHVSPNTIRQCGHLRTRAAALTQLMHEKADVVVLDDKRQAPMAVCCEDRSLFLARYHHAVSSLGLMSFEQKRAQFMAECRGKQGGQLRISIRRKQGLEFVHHMYSLTKKFGTKDWRAEWDVQYVGEEGLDYGGLTRELLTDTINALCSEEAGLFAPLAENQDLLHIAYPRTKQKLKYYKFAGQMFGKILFEAERRQTLSPVRLTCGLRCFLLGMHVSYNTFESDDPQLYVRKIKYILENEVEYLDLTFTDDDVDGKEVELVEGGADKDVTDSNKYKYVDLLAQWRLIRRVEEPLKQFAEGMLAVVPDAALFLLDEQDLELLLCGVPDFSVRDLKESCRVSPRCDKASADYVFHALRSFSHGERARFLQFVTGQAGVPVGGFAAFSPQIAICALDRQDCLPEAHTCFNQLVIPRYSSLEVCQRSLKTAISEGFQGFAML